MPPTDAGKVGHSVRSVSDITAPTTAAQVISASRWRSHLIVHVLPSSSLNSPFPSFIPATEQVRPDPPGDSDGPPCTTGLPMTSRRLSRIIGLLQPLQTIKMR